MKHTIEQICQAVDGTWDGGDTIRAVEGWSIDSRTTEPGDCFFAFTGHNRDGHDFVERAFEAGAAVAVVRRDYTRPDGTCRDLIRVEDGLEALHRLAAWSRASEAGLKVISVTGSSGKTSTKDIALSLLRHMYKISGNTGNLNNIWGLPIEILRRPRGLDYYFCEMGMSYPGELSRITRIGRPDIAVYTNIGMAHRANFDSVDGIATAKAEMLEGLRPGGFIVANADDPKVMEIATDSPERVFTYGIRNPANLQARILHNRGIDGLDLRIQAAEMSRDATLHLPGIHNVYNALAAMSAGLVAGADLENMLHNLKGIAMSPMRSALARYSDGLTVLDDSYNASPPAMRSMLSTVSESDGYGRRIAVLGDMLELGEEAPRLHWELGEFLAGASIDQLVTCGPLSVNTARAALSCGMQKRHVHICETVEEVLKVLADTVKSGDLVAVKGSRSMRMDAVVAGLARSRELAKETGDTETGD